MHLSAKLTISTSSIGLAVANFDNSQHDISPVTSKLIVFPMLSRYLEIKSAISSL